MTRRPPRAECGVSSLPSWSRSQAVSLLRTGLLSDLLRAEGSPSSLAAEVELREAGCGQAQTDLPSSPRREQQKARERQELWQGLEELRLRRLQGTQGAKEAPLQRLPPQVAANGGQS